MIRYEQRAVMRGMLAEADAMLARYRAGIGRVTDIADDLDALTERFDLVLPIWLDCIADGGVDDERLDEEIIGRIDELNDLLSDVFEGDDIIIRQRNRRARNHG
jgi:hypothetical protein